MAATIWQFLFFALFFDHLVCVVKGLWDDLEAESSA